MLALLAGVFWLTITGANVPSAMLAELLLDTIYPMPQIGRGRHRHAVVAQRVF